MPAGRFKAVVFDLDDTLYPESQFAASGFRAVARYIHRLYGLQVGEELGARYRAGERGDLFTPTLGRHFKRIEPALVQRLHEIMYCHRPTITLYPDARIALALLSARRLPIGLMTDQPGHLQRNKVQALELHHLIDSFAYADDLGGPDYWKPCPDAFHILAIQMEIEPHEMVYVGDDPRLDFIAPRALGMGAIRVQRDAAPPPPLPAPAQEAHITIPSLDMLWDALQTLERSFQGAHTSVPLGSVGGPLAKLN